MEFLKFNAQGQWSLHKVYNEPPKDANKLNNTPFKSYSSATATGQLHEDRGFRGALHDFGGGKRPKPEGVKSRRNWGKPPHVMDSVYNDQNPGEGD